MRFFVDPDRRLIRTIRPGDSTAHIDFAKWKEVSEGEFDEFRRETSRNYTTKQLKKLRAGP